MEPIVVFVQFISSSHGNIFVNPRMVSHLERGERVTEPDYDEDGYPIDGTGGHTTEYTEMYINGRHYTIDASMDVVMGRLNGAS